mgnify:CR=1 FL=1
MHFCCTDKGSPAYLRMGTPYLCPHKLFQHCRFSPSGLERPKQSWQASWLACWLADWASWLASQFASRLATNYGISKCKQSAGKHTGKQAGKYTSSDAGRRQVQASNKQICKQQICLWCNLMSECLPPGTSTALNTVPRSLPK